MEVLVSPKVFRAISSVDVDTILSCSDEELRPILACLVRQVFCWININMARFKVFS